MNSFYLKMKKSHLWLVSGLVLFILFLYFIFLWKFFIPDSNLENFYNLTKEDPLFFDPNMDAFLLQKEVSRLTAEGKKIIEVNNRFKDTLQEENRDVLPKGWRLWPDKFLGSLPKVDKLTRNFIENPTAINAVELLDQYEETAGFYERAADLNITALKKIFKNSPDLKNRKILFLGSATTPGIVYDDFLLIKKNARELKKQIFLRKICLITGYCGKKETQNPVLSAVGQEEYIDFKPLSSEILGVTPGKEILSGPFRASTKCFGSGPDGGSINYPFYIRSLPSRDGSYLLKPMLTNTKFYKDFREIPNEKTSQFYLQKGISIKPHAGINDYLCTDLRYIPDLLIQYLKMDNKLADDRSTENKLAVLPYLIKNTLSFSSFVSIYPDFVNQSLDPLYLITDRSAYSLYFGTFTPSIWRIEQEPVFLLDGDFKEYLVKAGFKQYQDLLNEGMTEDEIAKLNSIPHFESMFESFQQ